MPTIADFAATIASTSRAEFIAAHPHWILIYDPYEVDAGPFSEGESTTGATAHRHDPGDHVDPVRVLRKVAVSICKGKTNLYGSKVAIGRTSQCDIMILHPMLSRLHAFFFEELEALYLIDAGSRHGTYWKGVKLDRGAAQRIENGDDIMFAAVAAQVFSSGGFYEVVKYAASLVRGR